MMQGVRVAAAASIELGQVGPEDWQTWRDIRLESLRRDPDAFGSTYERELELAEADWRARLDHRAGPAFLAAVGSEPVGLGGGWVYEPGKLMVVAMWTAPAWRGHGVGTRILDRIVGWAQESGLAVDLCVADHNPRARALYERRGFVANGVVESLREGSELTMSRLELP